MLRGLINPITKSVLSISLLLGSLSSCAPEIKSSSKSKMSSVTSCVLSQDQSASLMFRWKSNPIPIAFRSGHFSTAEVAAAVEAAESWNIYFRNAYGFNVFDYGNASSPRTSTVDLSSNSAQLCGYSAINSSGGFASSIVIYKKTTWPSNLPSNAVAVTSTCKSTQSGNVLPNAFMSMMEVNYQNFFVNGQAAPDLESIFLHELGHLLGLDHSCASTAKAGHIACSANTDVSIYEAVMYPSASSTVTKQVLGSNDQGRASCLYGPHSI